MNAKIEGHLDLFDTPPPFLTRRPQPSFHAAKVETSKRLQKVLKFMQMRGGYGATTLDITLNCYTTRASSDISELSHPINGYMFRSEDQGFNDRGNRITRFWLVGRHGVLDGLAGLIS